MYYYPYPSYEPYPISGHRFPVPGGGFPFPGGGTSFPGGFPFPGGGTSFPGGFPFPGGGTPFPGGFPFPGGGTPFPGSGTPSTGGGTPPPGGGAPGPNGGAPQTPPPKQIPSKPQKPQGGVAYLVDPDVIRPCLYRFTYVWLTNGGQFWFYPTNLGSGSAGGYYWDTTLNRWVYYALDTKYIDVVSCI